MKPFHGKWKWGLADIGTVLRKHILAVIKPPFQKQGSSLYDLEEHDQSTIESRFEHVMKTGNYDFDVYSFHFMSK